VGFNICGIFCIFRESIKKEKSMNNPKTLETAKWICLGIGALLFLMAFTAGGYPEQAATAGMACFMGIISRICQAEQHNLSN
tara:strand:+ start:162 stop:407 length:246 start_codon:yes stop_codon:yes gene_type:complete